AAVLAQEEFHKEVDRLCVSERRWGTRREMRSRALKRHGDRCTFEVAVRTESGWHHVIGKVYKTDRSDVFHAMEALRRAGFSENAEFSIPQPLVYLSSLGVRLEEKVRGPSAKEIFLNGGRHERIAAAGRCGRWLARFHAASPRLDSAAQQFLSMYVSSGRENAMVNFPFYRALECLHGAKRDIVGQTPPAPDRAEIMLDEGLRALC